MTREDVLMVGIVGENPTSILVVARTLEPQRVLLVCTKKTEASGQILKEQLAPLRVEHLVLDSADSLELIQQQVSKKLPSEDGSKAILFDCTGGTKPMLLGVWQELQSKFGKKVRAVYLNPDGRLCEVKDGQVIESSAALTADEYLGWNRARKQKTSWEGVLADVPIDYLARMPVGRMLAQALGKGQRVEIHQEGWCRAGQLSWPHTLPAGLDRRGTKIFGEGKYFSQNGWLEEFCLAVAHKVASAHRNVHAYFGLHVLGLGGGAEGQDESDLVLVRGSRLVVIEAKAKKHNDSAGAQIQLRAQKASRFFGSMTRMIFVHPAWGTAPPAALEGLISRNVTLVGASERDLENAIKKALALL